MGIKAGTTEDMGHFWDRAAQQNAVSAICYHATPEEFEERGKRDAGYLLAVMKVGLRQGQGRCCAKRASILDLGGGIGRIARYLAPLVLQYHLVDVSEEMLKQAKERMERAVSNGRLILHQSNGYDLDGLKDASIDFGFADLVFQHMDREVVVSYLMDLRRVLKTGAWFWAQVPAMSYAARFAEATRGDWPANIRRWHPGEFFELCIRLGYRIIAADCDSMQVVIENGEMTERGEGEMAIPITPWQRVAGRAWLDGRSGA